MGRIWEDAPGGKPPRDMTPDEVDLLRRLLEADGRVAVSAKEASGKAIMHLLLRGAIFPSICAGDDALVYALTSTGRALCRDVHLDDGRAGRRRDQPPSAQHRS